MSRICIYVSLDPCIEQWFVHDCGGSRPVSLPRGGIESKVLESMLTRRPEGALPESPAGKLGIIIPSFRYRPPEVYNHLSARCESALVQVIRNRFDVALWRDLHGFGKIGRRQDELIYGWMEANGIEVSETNWNSIAKRYQRQRDLYLKRIRAKSSYNLSKK